MPHTFARSAGALFMLAGLSFWLGWALMPDAGTNDAAHILAAVGGHRAGVWWSVIVHLISSLAFALGVIGLQTEPRASRSKTMRVGAALVTIGAMGVCMDAFFHLVAFYMTAPGIAPAAVLESMRLLQTQGILFLIPLLLALIIGGIVYSAGLYHIDATSPWAKRVFLLGLAWALGGGFAAGKLGLLPRQTVAQGFLAIVAVGFVWMGFEVMAKLRPDTGVWPRKKAVGNGQ